MPVVIDPSAMVDPKNKILLYPERKRCRRCRSFFAFIVIDRLFCSYECADRTPPNEDVSTWPRSCRRRNYVPKVAYLYPEEAIARTPGKTTMHVYHCSHCGMYHIGSPPYVEKEVS